MSININSVQTEEDFLKTISESANITFVLSPYQIQFLRHHPLNHYIYDPKVDYDPKNERFKVLGRLLLDEFKKTKLYGNTEIVKVTKNGYILTGHRRCMVAIHFEIPIQIIVVDEIYDKDAPLKDKKEQITKYNKNKEGDRKEETYAHWLHRAKGEYELIKEHEPDMPDKKIRALVKEEMLQLHGIDWQQFLYAQKVLEEFNRPDLIKKIDDGEMKPKKALEEAKKVNRKKVEINPNQKVWKAEFEKNPEIGKLIKSEYIRIYKELSAIKTPDDTNMFDDTTGFEVGPITTVLSHWMMKITTSAIKKFTDINVVTAAAQGGGTPDIYFPDLTKEAKAKNSNYAPEVMEVKGASQTKDGNPKLYGGPGFGTSIHRDWYIVFFIDNKGERFFIMLVQIQKEDLKGGKKSDTAQFSNVSEDEDKKGYTCSFQDLMQNHYDKKDYYVIAGDVYKSSTDKFIMDFDKVK